VGLVEIESEVLQKTITEYVQENRVDLKRKVVTVLMSQSDSTETYLISTSVDDPFAYANKPFAYAKLGNAWVVFFHRRANPFVTIALRDSFFANLEKEGIKLEKGFVFYNPKYVLLELSASNKVKRTEL
jgi:hypothetical protein